jgi:hypothetical protein
MITRFLLCLRIMFGRRVLVLEAYYDSKHQRDRITMMGTLDNKVDQVRVLEQMVESLEQDLNLQEQENLRRLRSNPHPHAYPHRVRQ